ncbi:MAG: gliding motility-associated C-terminal domain-containing protein [Saprospiraceae bacterium]|nr:gliding motility-associated C-terminal domain-containing protein [Saprospiraceae bacterium]
MKRILTILILLVLSNVAFGTHNRAGEISIEQIGDCNDLTIKATIITYTKASSEAADRDSLRICWGDGNCEMVARSNGNGNGEQLGNDVQYNEYIAFHTYPGRSTYHISMTDPNRNAGILNVNDPVSDNVPFHIQTNYTFLNCTFDGPNSTPILLQPPIDIGCVGQPFLHNPNAVDQDGDSLSYQLIVPLQDVDTQVPNYLWPSMVSPGPDNNYFLNGVSGDFYWDAPQEAGEYNIAMYIISWRNGESIDTVIRDMQILIEDCQDNRPPTIETENYLCVVAGEIVDFDVLVNDPDFGQQVQLSALGAPFISQYSPAVWTAPSNYVSPPATGNFFWQTTCEHISDQPYTIVFKAVDNYFGNTGLSTLKTVRIKVVGPPPEDLQADAVADEIEINWESPYSCENAAENYFYTFSVWRREGSKDIIIDTCEPGLAGQGYQLIITKTRDLIDGRYRFYDSNVERGRTYCYRVLAQFARYTSQGQPYNIVESLTSEEICVQLARDIPLITGVDVLSTDQTTGEIDIIWTKPKAEDLDTLLNPGPYVYELQRGEGFNPATYQTVYTATSPTFWQANDTTFTDTALDTERQPYTYRVNFYVDNESAPIADAVPATSVFLSIASTDETNNLSWEYEVPWTNYEFTVYRQNNLLQWDSIATVETPAYSDQGLVNGREYCYYIRAIGEYSVPDIASPLLNRSQEECGIPLDTIPPCPPELDVSNLCDQAVSCIEADLKNELKWINPMNLCVETDDVVSYNIYYSPMMESEFELIETITFSGDTTYTHRPDIGIAGCYAVTAVDTFFNESAYSNIFCVDNCPIYELPNTFTPNGDGQNDLFYPFPYCFVERVSFRVFNRWGEMVFETENPDLGWDGRNLRGKELPEGTYYYTCQVYEQRVNGIIPANEILNGWIELIR